LQQPRLTGAIAVTSYTKTETTEKALDLSVEVLKRIADQGITAEQLSSVKAYIKGTFPTQRLETSDQLAAVLGDMEVYGLGKDDIDDLFSRIDAVSLADANEIAHKYFKTGNLTFVLLGNAAKIRDGAKKYAPKMIEVAITKPGIATD
jgi:predicted Zn-dependent peptidase